MRIIIGCLGPTPTDYLPILSSIQAAKLCRLGVTLSLAYRGSLNPDHILYGFLSRSSDARQERLRPRRLFVPAAWNRLNNLAGLGICVSEWTNHKCNAEYCENTSSFSVFIPKTSVRSVGMSVLQTTWVKLKHLRIDVGRFHSSMHKWGLAPSSSCECGSVEQTADHGLIACLTHRAPYAARGLTVSDDKTRCRLTTSLPASDPGSTVAWGSKRINPRSQSCLCLTWSGCPSKQRRRENYFNIYFGNITNKLLKF